MKKSGIVVLVLVMWQTWVYAQLAEPLLFNEKIHDFGEILEDKGHAEYEFVFTNNSGRPVKIISVQASCGCTTPDWSKDAIAPGKNGFIKASFDPHDRPGYFDKSLSVATDLSATPVILQIKGTVVDRLTEKNELLSAANGNLRLKNNSFNLGKIFINRESSSAEFAVLNEGKGKIEFKETVAPPYIQVTTPRELKPGERSVIKIKYDARAKGHYGFQSDNIELKTTDTSGPVKTFSVYTTIEEYFPSLSTEEMAKAPALAMERYELNFSRVNQGSEVNNSLFFVNRGKKNLEIRYIQSNCSCVIASSDKQVLKPGESGTISIRFNTEGRGGTQNKAITVYSNDPRNPVQRVTITGYVEG